MKFADLTIQLLALWLIPGIGPRRIAWLMEHYQPLENVFSTPANRLADQLGIDRQTAEQIPRSLGSKPLKRELDLVSRLDLTLIDLTQASYPKLLREIWDAPPVLYVRGEIGFNSGLPVAFVGSRKASYSGKSLCQKLIRQIAEYDVGAVIVSGLALGIDTAAHRAALESGLKTIAVLGSGLADIYPPQNRKLADAIVENGALISEFPVSSKPLAINFPLRNRIISGLSKGSVIVEAGGKSGATITAGYALEQNRELFALPGPVDSRFSLGTNRLIQKGQAKLVLEAGDILEEILPDFQPEQTNRQLTFPQDLTLSSLEKQTLDRLKTGVVHRDHLAGSLGMPMNQLLAILTTLEIKGLIVSKPGATYQVL